VQQSKAGAAQAGFTLLEFLVAFTMLVLFVSSILMGVAIALRGDEQAAFLVLATAQAKSKLSAITVEPSLRPGVTTGRFDNQLEWRVTVRPYGLVQVTQNRGLQGYWVEIAVSDPARHGRRSVAITGFEIRNEVRS
jgi:type II secretory pathway pseudopilin PulG